jgi:hypothetical protein
MLATARVPRRAALSLQQTVASFTILVALIFTPRALPDERLLRRTRHVGPVARLPAQPQWCLAAAGPASAARGGLGGPVVVAASVAQSRRPFAGAVFLGAAAAYGAGRLLLESTRASAGSGGSRANMVFSAMLMLGASIVLLSSWRA